MSPGTVSSIMRRRMQVEALDGYAPEIGTWLWAMEATRDRTKRYVRDLAQDIVDWPGPDGTENSIGAQLYHLALIELDWLFADMLLRPDLVPAAEFPFEPFTGGRLTPVTGVPLDEHIARLDRTRATFLDQMRSIPADAWSRLREPAGEDYAVTPAWVVFHLVEHEAGHAAQIASLRRRALLSLR